MKLKNFLILLITTASTSLLQGTYTCKAMKPNIDLSMTRKEKEKAPKRNESEDKYKRYSFEALNPDNEQVPTKAKFGRYGKRCRCQKCYWTGYPSTCKERSNIKYLCGGCNSGGIINGEVLTHWSDDKIPGIELSLDFGKCSEKDNGPHNGFIFDKRLAQRRINRIKLSKIKKTNEKYWFYCYSCKEYFLVPMNAIQHPKNVFDY